MADPAADPKALNSALDFMIRWYVPDFLYEKQKRGELDLINCDAYLGLYYAYKPEKQVSPAVKRPFKKASDSQTIQLPGLPKLKWAYKLEQNLQPVSFKVEPDGAVDVDLNWVPSKENNVFHLVVGRRLGDLVQDSKEELEACKFPWFKLVSDLSGEERKVYSKDLGKIEYLPPGVLVDQDSHNFVEAMAAGCTYDQKGKYFGKWKKKFKAHSGLGDYSEAYIKATLREQKLKGNWFYALVQSSVQYELYRLDGTDDGLHIVPLDQSADPYWAAELNQSEGARTMVTIFWTIHGEEQESQAVYNIASIKPSEEPSKNLVDPRAQLRKLAGAKFGTLDKTVKRQTLIGEVETKGLKLKDDFAWFVEWADANFPAPFGFVSIKEAQDSAGLSMPFEGTDLYRKGVNGQIRKELEKLKGDDPQTKEIRRRVTALLDDPDKLILAQGAKDGDSRFVGTDNTWAYFRNVETGVTWKISLWALTKNLLTGAMGADLYQRTKGLVPLIQILVWAAVIVVALEVVGLAAAYEWVKRQVSGQIAKKAMKEAAILAGAALASLMAQLVLTFFDGDKAKRWKWFAEGFFDGYVKHAVLDHFHEHIKTLYTDGPLEYRIAMALKNLRATIAKVEHTSEVLRNELTEQSLKEGLERFQGIIVHLVQGAALLMSAFYYVEHKDAEPVMKVIGDMAESKHPDMKEWNDQAAKALAAFIRELSKGIYGDLDKLAAGADKSKKTLHDIGGVLDKLFGNPAVGAVLIGAAIQGLVFAVGKIPTKAWLLLGMGGMVLGAKALENASAETAATINELFNDFYKDFPGTDKVRAKKYGDLVGQLFGGILVDRALHKGADGIKNSFDSPILKKVAGAATFSATINLHHGKVGWVLAVLKVILKRYVAIAQELKDGLLANKRDESAFAAAITDIKDEGMKKKGQGRWIDFRATNETGMSLHGLAVALFNLKYVLDEDQKDFLKNKYQGDIAKYKADLKEFESLMEKSGVEDWAKKNADMFFHHFQLHLRLAATELLAALEDLLKPFTKSGFSWGTLLEELGLEVGDLEKIHADLEQNMQIFNQK